MGIPFILMVAVLFGYKTAFAKEYYIGADHSPKAICRNKITYISFICVALLGLGLFYFGVSFCFVRWADLTVSLLTISIIDIKYKVIPNELSGTLFFTQLAFLFLTGHAFSWMGFGIAATVFLMLMLVSIATKEKIGMGDAKLISAICATCELVFFMASLLLGLIAMFIFSVAALILKRIQMKSQLPFAPFYTAGILLTLALSYF